MSLESEVRSHQDLHQSPEYANYMKQRGWEVEKTSCQPQTNAFIRKIPLIGSVIKIQRPTTILPEEELDNLAQRHHALFIKTEPYTKYQMLNTKYQKDTWPLLPSKTIHLDLTRSEKKLWENLDSDARYSIRKAKKSLCVKCYKHPQLNPPDAPAVILSPARRGEESQDNISNRFESPTPLKTFYQLLKITGRSKHFYTPKWQDLKLKTECFNTKAWLLLAYKPISLIPPKALAGCLLLIHDNVAYYHHAANSPEGRKLLAGYLVLWEAIKLAKELGCHTFDFEGVYDERFPKATRDWKGFTNFKKKFLIMVIMIYILDGLTNQSLTYLTIGLV